MKLDSSYSENPDQAFMSHETNPNATEYSTQETTPTSTARKIVEDALENIELSADIKEELVDFTSSYFTVSPDNVNESLKEALFELTESLRDLLEDKGLMVNYDGTIEPENPINVPLLKQPEIAGPYEKYLELTGFKEYLDVLQSEKSTVPERIPSSVELIETALDTYNLPPDVKAEIFEEIYSKNSNAQEKINPSTVENFILKAADSLKILILVGLYKNGFSLNDRGQLLLPENKKELLDDETIALNLKQLEAFYKITNPGKTSVEVVLTTPEEQPTNKGSKTETISVSPEYKIRLDLTKFGFSEKSIKTAENETIASLLGDSTIGSSSSTQRGLTGFEQIISRAIADLQAEVGFTLDSNREPVLKENWLQKTLLAWNKKSRIKETKASPEYQQLVDLLDLQAETRQKIAEEATKKRSTGRSTAEIPSYLSNQTEPKPEPQPNLRKGGLSVTALAGAAAGIMAGTALYKNQETDALESFDENTLVVSKKEVASKKQTSPTFSPRFEEIDSTQPRRPLSEAPTVVDVPVVTAREAEPASTRTANQVLEETKPTVVKKSTFKKPTSFGSKQAPKRFKIDPFTYQDTDPAEAPKLERPADDSEYEEAPDLDNPPAYHKRLVEKTFKKPTPITKETVRNTTPGKPVPRKKESPYLATPSVSGTVKGPEEKVKPQLSLSADKQKTNGAGYENKTLPDLSISKDSPTQDTYTQKNTEEEIFNKMYFAGQDIYYKIRELADIEIDRPKIEAGETRINPALLAKHEQKIRADLKQMWINFATNKNQALKIGEEMIKNLKDRLTNTTNKKEIEVLTNQIATLRGEIRDIEDIAQHSTDSLFQKIKEERSADLANALKKMNRSKNKPEANPVLKPVARQKESPYLATPSVPGTVKGPEEKVNPEFSLDNKLEPYPVLKRIKKKPDNTLPAGPNVAKAK